MTNFCELCKKQNYKYRRALTCLLKPDMNNRCTQIHDGGEIIGRQRLHALRR